MKIPPELSKDPYLMPCPFCSEKDSQDVKPMVVYAKKKHFDKLHFTVQCTNCGCEPDYCVESESEAIQVWSTRRNLSKNEMDIAHLNELKNKIINELLKIEIK